MTPAADPAADTDRWMELAVDALHDALGDRLLVVGLQGSVRRGEATPASDIDVVIVLDELSAGDTRRCRSVLQTLPEGHRAHGFTAGRAELAGWPRTEIFAFAQDVRCYHGELAPLLPSVTPEDVVDGARLAVSGVYHAVAHTLMSESEPEPHREGLQKMLFFAMLQTAYLRSGTFAATRAELIGLLDRDEAALLTGPGESFFDGALAWSARQLRHLGR